MIAIADSGSTKTDWVILDNDHNEALRTETIGFNPYHIDSESINQEMNKNEDLKKIADQITNVYLYGAGCSADFLKKIVIEGFKPFFTKAEILIDHDLLF